MVPAGWSAPVSWVSPDTYTSVLTVGKGVSSHASTVAILGNIIAILLGAASRVEPGSSGVEKAIYLRY